MSAIGFLVLLVIAIIALMLLMTKVKLNPVMSLFVVALGFGVTLGIFGTEGYSFMETLTLITTGFGNTLGSLGMPIILGAVLAMGVQDTGAAKSIANFFIRLFRGKNLELAPSLTAYVGLSPCSAILQLSFAPTSPTCWASVSTFLCPPWLLSPRPV